MTRTEKIRILKAMKRYVRQGKGFCSALDTAHILENINKCSLKNLGIHKPKKTWSYSWWYDWNDSAIRLKKIDQAIKRLQK